MNLNKDIMTPEEIYVSPDNEVLVTNFNPHYHGKELKESQYTLKVNRWYKVGEKAIAPNATDFIYVIHDDGVHIGHLPENFMTISEWREKQIQNIL